MSLAFEQSSQPLVTSVSLDGHSSHSGLFQALLELSQCAEIYSGDIDAAAAVITHSIVKNLAITDCQVWLYTDDRSLFESVAHYGTLDAHQPGPSIKVDEHANYFQQLTQRDCLIVNTGEPVLSQLREQSVRDIQSVSRSLPPYLDEQAQAITALLEFPVYHQEQIVGVLCCVQQQFSRVWQAVEKSFIVTAVSLIALAISHASNQQKKHVLTKQKRQLTLEMIERQQAEQAWQESQRFIQGILDASTNILYVNDFSSGTNYYVNGYMEDILGYSSGEIQQFGGQFLESLAHPDTVKAIHQTRKKLAQADAKKEFIVENEYCLRHKQGNWLWMLCRETIFQWNQDGTPKQLLGTATDITAHKEKTQALQQQNQQLTALARLDALTQIANRRAFDEFLGQAWTVRNQTPLTLILCDIDYFKLYNDSYGHQAGDACLQRVAQALQKAVKRQLDLVARYGGEEFAIVLPNTTLTGAQHVARGIQTAVRELEIEHCSSTVSDYLTVSLGIATITLTGPSMDKASYKAFIAAADRGLYQAKSNGRAQFAIGHVDMS